MTILVGIDSSERSLAASSAAGRLAQRMGRELHTASIGRDGEELLSAIGRLAPELIVVAAPDADHAGESPLGSHLERIAQKAHVPLLSVRNAEPFEAWARGDRPLRIVLGADLSLATEAAVRWIGRLRAFGPCEVIAVNLFWPPAQLERLGFAGVRDYLNPGAEVLDALEGELRRHLAGWEAESKHWNLRLEPHIGGVGERLAALSNQDNADLLVVGTHGRGALGRIVEGSVSYGALRHARSSVACVPITASVATQPARALHEVVVATDFSPFGNAAIAYAYAITAPGGTVHLIHVIHEEGQRPGDPHDVFADAAGERSSAALDEARKQLAALVPSSTVAGEVHTCVHVLRSNRVAEAIAQAGERLDADALCLSTHGRSGVSKALLGSVAQGVLTHTRRPVLLTRGEKP